MATDAQQALDNALISMVDRWNTLNAAQRGGPDGVTIMGEISRMVTQRNGADAARAVTGLTQRGNGRLDARRVFDAADDVHPRVDGPSSPSPQPSPPPQTPDPTHSDAYTAAPGDGRKWLPGNEKLPRLGDADSAALNAADAHIEDINSRLFHVDPALAWKPGGAELPHTGANISTLGQTYELTNSSLSRLRGALDELDAAFGRGDSGEPLLDEQYQRLRPALDKLITATSNSQREVPGAIARTGIAANDAFHHALRGSNLAARTEVGRVVTSIASARDQLQHSQTWGGGAAMGQLVPDMVTNNDFATVPGKVADPDTRAVDDEVRRLREVTAGIGQVPQVDKQGPGAPTTHPGGKSGSGGGGAHSGGTRNAASGGPSVTGSGGAPTGKSVSDSDLAKLINSLGQAAQQGGVPGGSLPQQAAQAAQQAAQPLADAARQGNQKVDPELLRALQGEKPKPGGPASGAHHAAAAAAATPPGPATPSQLGKPGSPARPHQLDATGKPADKDRDGRVDADAKPLSKRTVRPFDLTVRSRDQLHNVHGVPDPRIGEMMQTMADASEDHPVSVLDAARQAGMDIKGLGDPHDVADAKVGQAIVGDGGSGMYLGDGQVLTSTGDVRPVEDVASDSGYAADVPLPELPDDAPGPLPSPEPSPAPEPQQEPSPEQSLEQLPAPQPAPATAPDSQPAPAPAPEPAPQQQPQPAPASMPSQVPYEGHAIG